MEVEEKEILSRRLNEGRFMQNNDGWTRGFTADVYLKRDGKYSFGTEGVICRYTYHPPPLHHTPPHPHCNRWPPHEGRSYLLHRLFIPSERGEIREASSARLSESGRQTAKDRRKIPSSRNFRGEFGEFCQRTDRKTGKVLAAYLFKQTQVVFNS